MFKPTCLKPRTLAATIATLLAVAGFNVQSTDIDAPRDPGAGASFDGSAIVGNVGTENPARYIVRFVEPPLAMYNQALARSRSNAVTGIGEIPFKTFSNGRKRLDVSSAQAKNYVQFLQAQQQRHLGDIAFALNEAVTPLYKMQHALNAVLLSLTPEQAKAVAAVAGVVAVERDRPRPVDTDIGPGFIGASSLWWGKPAGQDTVFTDGFESVTGFRGEGLVIGDIDTGYNSLSPSFAAIDAQGYHIQNPLGSGNFLGECNVANISKAGCNDKVIGVYDMVDLTGSCSGTCPSQHSVEDTQGHGSHTASTAAGNGRLASLSGYTAPISGVAPRANLVIYYACSPDSNILCSNAATSASVDQAIQDGIVDALNYSIGGGTDPWNEATSLAFLSAQDAGIFIAASAGNTSTSTPEQLPGTLGHMEAWVATVAASNHTGSGIVYSLTVNALGAPGPLPLLPAASGTGISAPINAAAIKVSPTFNVANDGCSAYPAGTFTGSIALLKYDGTCGTNTRANNARLVGATHVVLVTNSDSEFLSAANQTIPVWTTRKTIGTSLATFLGSNPSSTVNVAYPAARFAAQPDQLADFSLLGPSGFDSIKPDVQAPGVSILAAIANDNSVNGPNRVGLYNGTSMAAPHTTGSGAMLMGLHPGWTPMEVKSALMMTAQETGLTKADGTTPSDYFDRGSGRIQVDVASKAGLVLNETGLNFTNANPADGGDPTTLNIASMQDQTCVNSCVFTRKFRSTQDKTVTWTASIANGPSPGFNAVTVSPSSFQVVANGTRPVTFTVNSSALPPDGSFHFAAVTLTANDPALPPLHLPIAVAVPPPTLAADPQQLAIGIPNMNTTASVALSLKNIGGGTLNVTNTNKATGTGRHVLIDQPADISYGYFSTYFTDYSDGFYTADDFVVSGASTNLAKVVIPGFSTGTALSALTGHGVHLRIYANAAGLPNGGPQGLGNPAVYSYDTIIGATGLSVAGNTISLDLIAAGAPATNLAAGTYWLTVWVDMAYASQGAFAQYITPVNQGNLGLQYAPLSNGTNWAAIAGVDGFALRIEQAAPCGAAWLSTNTPSANIGGASSISINVTANSTQFPGGSPASAFLCIESNDAKTPVLAIPVTATQN